MRRVARESRVHAAGSVGAWSRRNRLRTYHYGGLFFKSVRAVPRPRRSVAAWVLVVLWPLFHYDDWPRAWVLRVIGHRYGPVLIRAESDDEPEDWAEREPSRLRRMVGRAQVLIPERASRVLSVGGSAVGMTNRALRPDLAASPGSKDSVIPGAPPRV